LVLAEPVQVLLMLRPLGLTELILYLAQLLQLVVAELADIKLRGLPEAAVVVVVEQMLVLLILAVLAIVHQFIQAKVLTVETDKLQIVTLTIPAVGAALLR
jgi:hypothetical protein